MNESEKKNLVMVFGTFDYLHAGHENLFTQARELGDEILAVVALDKTVKAIKGASPQNNEKERLSLLKKTEWANKVILGDTKDKMKAIKIYRPDIIALGYDQFAFSYYIPNALVKLKLNAKVVRLLPYRPHMYKSSLLKHEKVNINSVTA